MVQWSSVQTTDVKSFSGIEPRYIVLDQRVSQSNGRNVIIESLGIDQGAYVAQPLQHQTSALIARLRLSRRGIAERILQLL